MKVTLIIIGVIAVVVIAYFVYHSAYKPTPQSGSGVSVDTTQVSIKNFSFNPDNNSVSVGQAVTFTNNDSAVHTITADDNSFNSGNLPVGQSYKHVFNQAGTFSYHCSIHTTMKGTVVVK